MWVVDCTSTFFLINKKIEDWKLGFVNDALVELLNFFQLIKEMEYLDF